MNDLLYYEPLADLLETDETYLDASTQVRFGYLTLTASFHWNLLKLLGNVAPTYHLAPPAPSHDLLWFNENGHLDKGDKIDGGGVRR
jgi:hypothetical protein